VYKDTVIIISPIKRTERSIAMCMWCLIAFIGLGLLTQWFTVSRRDRMFTDYVNHVIRDGAKEQLTAKEIRRLLLTQADDLSLQVHPDSVLVSGSGPTLRASVNYYADLSMPLVNERIYRMRFTHVMTGR
jgi:hypothetical protein